MPHTDLPSRLQSLLDEGVAQHLFTGVQVAYAIDTPAITALHSGTTDTDRHRPITRDTFFDIASLTKLFTATAALRAADDGRLPLHTPIAQMPLPPRWQRFGARNATVAHLLRHTSGLPAWHPYFADVPLPQRGTPQGHQHILQAVLDTPCRRAVGAQTEYSDLGFIALAALLSDVLGRPFADIVAQFVLAPLQLSQVHFRPLEAPSFSDAPYATTGICPWHHRPLTGAVHDDNARAMGGVAGHAGLFARAEDIATLGCAWLGALERDALLRMDTAQEAIDRDLGERGLGVDLKSPTGSSAGDSASPHAFGHLGFTGCSLWVDPARRALLALLANRTRTGAPSRAMSAFRRRCYELFFSSIAPGGSAGGFSRTNSSSN
ncbi:MAG: beta-lactamase family protein [Myxococcales bacterium]|nr:beta-lactamase family protein [Myxococcales bacterium]